MEITTYHLECAGKIIHTITYLCTCISAILTQKNAYISTTRSGLAIMIRNNAEEKGCRDGPESRI